MIFKSNTYMNPFTDIKMSLSSQLLKSINLKLLMRTELFISSNLTRCFKTEIYKILNPQILRYLLKKEQTFCLFSQWVKLLILVYMNIIRVYSFVYPLLQT